MNALADRYTALYYSIIWLFAAIGYGYVFIFPILTILSLGLIINAVTTKSPLQWELNDWTVSIVALLVGVIATWISSKIIKIKPDLPTGKPLDEKGFPTLLGRISEVCSSFDAPEIHHVKLTPHFRIEITRTPTSGFPLKYTNTLLIGLPVMSCTSPLQFKLLLARHIGYLAQAKTGFNKKINYLRHILKIYNHTYGRSWKPDTILLRLFYSWYVPFFNLTAIPMERIESYNKDKCMLEVAPSDNIAAAITDFHIKKLFMETRFWPELNNSAYKLENPPYFPYASMSRYIAKELNADNIRFLYETEIARDIEIDSNIPSLKDRLFAIGYDELIAADESTDTAANYFFGESTGDIYKQFDNVWYLKNKKTWNQKYSQSLQEKEQLKLMRGQLTKSLLSDTEMKEYLQLIERYIAPERALPLYKEIINTNPQDSDLCFDLGRFLLNADDSSGINVLKTSMEQNPAHTVDCCNHIVEYLVKHGDAKEAQHYRHVSLEHQAER
jgi:hypothetical protein